MNCLNCKEPMLVFELHEVEVDYCLECGGIWLDNGELEILVDDTNEVRRMLAQFAAGEETVFSKRRCPICHKKMKTVKVDEKGTIRIEYCTRHHGIWFDENELKEVIEIFDQDENNEVPDLLREVFKKQFYKREGRLE